MKPATDPDRIAAAVSAARNVWRRASAAGANKWVSIALAVLAASGAYLTSGDGLAATHASHRSAQP